MTPFQQTMDIAYHLVLPVITLTMLSIGGLMRYTRTNMLEVLNSDYIRTARAKGLSEKVVINKHAFRNTLIPLVSYMSYFDTQYVWRFSDHGDPLPNSRYWLYLIYGNYSGRYSFCNVLYNFAHSVDPSKSHHSGYHVCSR